MLVDDVDPGVFGSNQEMEMRVAVWQASKGMIKESFFFFEILDW